MRRAELPCFVTKTIHVGLSLRGHLKHLPRTRSPPRMFFGWWFVSGICPLHGTSVLVNERCDEADLLERSSVRPMDPTTGMKNPFTKCDKMLLTKCKSTCRWGFKLLSVSADSYLSHLLVIYVLSKTTRCENPQNNFRWGLWAMQNICYALSTVCWFLHKSASNFHVTFIFFNICIIFYVA